MSAPRAVRELVLLLALFFALLVLALAKSEPCGVRASDAPASEFSAERALTRWRALPGSAVAHPVGSAAHETLRAAIVLELRELGWDVEVQETFAKSEGNALSVVRNVLARRPDAPSGKAVLVCAHYDSVPAGPGAGDDGAGAASVLEIARALAQSAPLAAPVILLIDDAEEVGLVGAEAFCSQHPWAKEVGAVVNLEARGTSGPAFLFETSGGSSGVIALAARTIPRPSATSASTEIYKRMPNSTDLAVFKREGWFGANFAFLEGLRHYHTPLDSAEELSSATVQHMGESAWAMVRAFGQSDLAQMTRSDAVYADVFGAFVVRWPETFSVPIGLVLLALSAFVIQRGSGWRGAVGGAVLALGAVALAATAAAGLQALVCWLADTQYPPAAEPAWMSAALILTAVLAVILVARTPIARRLRSQDFLAGLLFLSALGGALLAWFVPGLSYLFIVPTATALAALALGGSTLGMWLFSAAVFWFPLAIALAWTFEFAVSPALAALYAFVALPLLASSSALGWRAARNVLALGAFALVVFTLATLRSPAWTREHPASLNLQHFQETVASQSAAWRADSREAELPESLRALLSATAPRVELSPPRIELIASEARPEGRRLKLALASTAGAARGWITLGQGARIASAAWGKHELTGDLKLEGSTYLFGFGSDALLFTLETGSAPVTIDYTEVFPGLPASGQALLEARPAERVPRSWGDVSLVHTHVTY